MTPVGHSHVLIALLLIASSVAVAGSRLSPEEDSLRSISCGKVIESKLFDGENILGSAAPWAIQVGSVDNTSSWHYSGFLISLRHALASADMVLTHSQNPNESYRWYPDYKNVDMSTCNDGVMPIPPSALKVISVYSCVEAQLGKQCSNDYVNVTNGFYYGNCNDTKISYGFAVFELASPLPPSVVPLCVTDQPAQVGENVTGYAYGADGEGSMALRTRVSTVKKCADNIDHLDLSICMDAGTCYKDAGGSATRLTDGQRYVLGVFWTSDCKNDGNSKHPAFTPFAGKVCEHTGVCLTSPTVLTTTPAPTPPPTPPPTQIPVQEPKAPEAPVDVEEAATTATATSGDAENSTPLKLLSQTALLTVLIFLL